MSKKILLLLAIPLLLIVAAAILIPLLLDEEKILAVATRVLHDKTGATLTVAGDTSLSLYPTLGVSLADASLAMPGQEQPDLHIGALDIGVQLLPLLSGSVAIDGISLDQLSARLHSAPQEKALDTSGLSDAELDAFYARRREMLKQQGDTTGAALAVPLALNVKRLDITDSRIELVPADGSPGTVIELTRLHATGLNLDGEPIPLEAEFRLPGEHPLDIALEGRFGVDQGTQKIQLQPLQVEVGGALEEKLLFSAIGEADLSRQSAALTLEVESGEISGEGSLRYASFESPQIDAKLRFNLFNPALLALAGPQASTSPESPPASGDEPLPLDAIRLIDTRADLTIERAVFAPHTISNLHAKLRALNGVVTISTLTGELYSGKLDASATFNGKHNTALLETAGKVAAVDVASALQAMETKALLSGRASLDWQLTSKGRTTNELVAALNGPITLDTQDAILKNVAVERMICQAVALVNQEKLTASFPADSAFTALGAQLQLADGKVQLSPLQAALPQIGLTGTGALDLLSKDLKATFKARLSPELEQLDPACRVNQRLTAIDWPVKCKGSLNTDPGEWCAVDTGDIIKELTRNEAQRRVKKEAGKLFEKLLD
ncbi:MAG: AsmA family protein [Halioglobus sp.]|nr:AsmA family protein [Halioglobus sp.]